MIIEQCDRGAGMYWICRAKVLHSTIIAGNPQLKLLTRPSTILQIGGNAAQGRCVVETEYTLVRKAREYTGSGMLASRF